MSYEKFIEKWKQVILDSGMILKPEELGIEDLNEIVDNFYYGSWMDVYEYYESVIDESIGYPLFLRVKASELEGMIGSSFKKIFDYYDFEDKVIERIVKLTEKDINIAKHDVFVKKFVERYECWRTGSADIYFSFDIPNNGEKIYVEDKLFEKGEEQCFIYIDNFGYPEEVFEIYVVNGGYESVSGSEIVEIIMNEGFDFDIALEDIINYYKELMDEKNILLAKGDLSKLVNLRDRLDDSFDDFYDSVRCLYESKDENGIEIHLSNSELFLKLGYNDAEALKGLYLYRIEELKDNLLSLNE